SMLKEHFHDFCLVGCFVFVFCFVLFCLTSRFLYLFKSVCLGTTHFKDRDRDCAMKQCWDLVGLPGFIQPVMVVHELISTLLRAIL
ncbi:mCG145427, partial [Mus musculus]